MKVRGTANEQSPSHGDTPRCLLYKPISVLGPEAVNKGLDNSQALAHHNYIGLAYATINAYGSHNGAIYTTSAFSCATFMTTNIRLPNVGIKRTIGEMAVQCPHGNTEHDYS
jgi:hypothetical protein